jgi:hypothetical protein
MNCNKRRTSALGDSVDVEIEKRGAVVAYSVGVLDVEIEKRDAVVALLSLDNPGGGDATSPRYDVVVKDKEGGAEAEEADGGRDDIDFEGDSDNLGRGEEETALTDGAMDPVGNVGAKDGSTDDEDEIGLEGGAEAEEEDGGRDDIDFEGDGNNLGRYEEETTLTDGTMDLGGDVGAEEGPVNDMDEIGLIFNFEDIKTKVCLKECGSYVKFNNKCLHRGYKKGSVKTYLSAQLFSAPMGKRRTVQYNVAKFEEGTLIEDNLSVLKSISKAVQRGWKDKYMKTKFNAPKTFQFRKLNQEKTRKINQEYIKDTDLVEVRKLIEIFETIYPDIRVTKVWFLKKKEMGDGFEDFHYDYGSSMG